MKVFFDTNVLVAAFISHGACCELFDHCLENHSVFTSNFVLDELVEKLFKKFHLTEAKVLLACDHLRTHATITSEAPLSRQICEDHDDDHIIAAGLNAKVDCIVTGDKKLLELIKVFDIPIIQPGKFWEFEENSKMSKK
jgi:putative PIN family toxin of toxin-antitoxin system